MSYNYELGDREALTILEFLKTESISARHRILVAIQERTVPDATLKTWVSMTTGRAVRNHALNCGIPKVESWSEKWLSGEDRSKEAASEALSAIYEARESWKSWMSASKAVCAVSAAEAASCASEVAAYAASAVRSSARDEELQQQLRDMIELLEEKK